MTGADLTFDVLTHAYYLGATRVPSVTHILAETGVAIDFTALAASSRVMASALDRKRLIGTACHADCHAFDDNDLQIELVHPEVVPYVQAWQAFRDAHPFLLPKARERRVYHSDLRYCGTLDGIFENTQGQRFLIDIKTGDPEASAARYQLALYQLAWEHEHPDDKLTGRWSVQLSPDLAQQYHVYPYRDFTDFATARAIVTTYYASARRSLERKAA